MSTVNASSTSMETQQQDIDEALALVEAQKAFDVALREYNIADTAHDSLEVVYDVLKTEQENGLSPEAAYYLGRAVDGIGESIGLTEPVVPSMEQFSGYLSRVSTSLSMEGIRECLEQASQILAQRREKLSNRYSTLVAQSVILKARNISGGQIAQLLERAAVPSPLTQPAEIVAA
jgi:hypothetical protein